VFFLPKNEIISAKTFAAKSQQPGQGCEDRTSGVGLQKRTARIGPQFVRIGPQNLSIPLEVFFFTWCQFPAKLLEYFLVNNFMRPHGF
jgi:hypothetical protein